MDIETIYAVLAILLGFIDGVILVVIAWSILLFRKDTIDFEKLVRNQLKNRKC